MQGFAELRFKPEMLAEYGLPDIPYPISTADFELAIQDDGHLPLAVMLYGLQQQSREGSANWRETEPALQRLAELLAPDDSRDVLSAEGEDWWLEIGPVDISVEEMVTIQRDGALIAAIVPRRDGRLRVAAYRPLDAKSLAYLIALSHKPHPVHGVSMRENNWEYALDSSAANGNHYASAEGLAYLSYWKNGLGISHDGSILPDWRAQIDLVPRPLTCVVAELGVYYMLSNPDTVETPVTKKTITSAIPTWQGKRQQTQTVRGRFLGCLLGGAVGDALGAPVEFMSRQEILRRFGPRGITQYAPAYGGLGTITDDTQMTLFTAEGLLRGWVLGCFNGSTSYIKTTANAYLRWLLTQDTQPNCAVEGISEAPGWLFQQKALHSRRAPGNTCLSALSDMAFIGEPASNNSKGCGGVMRVAPVGLFAWRLNHANTPQGAFSLGNSLAALTHGHPTGALTGGVLAVLILALTDGASLQEALATAKAILREERDYEETLRAIEQAETLAESGVPPEAAIARLGEGWIAEEALAISIYCALVARNFRDGLILAVNHDGDSDSTGAIVGNLLGAMHGVTAIPAEWLDALELREVITELAEDLYAFKDWPIGNDAKNDELNARIWQKYPGF